MESIRPWQQASRPWQTSRSIVGPRRTLGGAVRMPDGAEVVATDGDTIRMQVSKPLDEHGFFGRQCPSCTQLFRVDAAEYKALPDELKLCCVYCGHRTDASDFITDQQLERAKSAVGAWAMQQVHGMLDNAFRGIAQPQPRTGGFGIQISYQWRPFYPRPLPGIDEEQLIRVRDCATCGLHYAVFGEHRFCPVCGPLRPDVVALDALAAEIVRLDVLTQLPADAAATLREHGGLTRIWVDTLENLVGAVGTLAGAVFHAAVPNADQILNGKGAIFQRLERTADLFAANGYPDLRQRLNPATWQRLLQTWATRHAFTHRDGVVDAKYLNAVPSSPARLGQRLTVTERQVRQAISDSRELCTAISGLISTP
jgi:hypothetical protein